MGHVPNIYIYTELKPYKPGLLKVQKDIIKLCHETNMDVRLLVAPDPNQVVWMQYGGDAGASFSCKAIRKFVPKDAKTSIKTLKSGTVEVQHSSAQYTMRKGICNCTEKLFSQAEGALLGQRHNDEEG